LPFPPHFSSLAHSTPPTPTLSLHDALPISPPRRDSTPHARRQRTSPTRSARGSPRPTRAVAPPGPASNRPGCQSSSIWTSLKPSEKSSHSHIALPECQEFRGVLRRAPSRCLEGKVQPREDGLPLIARRKIHPAHHIGTCDRPEPDAGIGFVLGEGSVSERVGHLADIEERRRLNLGDRPHDSQVK